MNTFFVSAITMDHVNFQADIQTVERLGVDGLHIDVMDGHFVPRYGIYPEIASRINDVSDLPLDLHLMVDDVFFALEQFKEIRHVKYVRFHMEACGGNEMRVVDRIRNLGASPIACLNLATGFHSLSRLSQNNEIDGVMLMGIHPGVLKQNHRPENILHDMAMLKQVIGGTSAEHHIGLDGAVNFDTMPALAAAGVNNFIGGSSTIFKDVAAELSVAERAQKISENWTRISSILAL